MINTSQKNGFKRKSRRQLRRNERLFQKMEGRYSRMRSSDMGRSESKLAMSTLKDVGNDNNLKLKINPKYQIQTRPYIPSEYKRLKDSMKEIGQEQPIIIDEVGYILDGHHRLKVCEELGLKPWVVISNYESEEQKIRAINQLNWARRHWELYMSAEAMRSEFEAKVRAEQELKYQKGKKGTQPIDVKNLTPIAITGNNENIHVGNEKKDGRVNSKLGEIVGVTSTTIWQWKQVLDNANNEQLEALKQGKTTPHKVYEKLKAAKKQENIIQQSLQINSRFSLPDQATIYCGDFRDPAILAKIPDSSVSLYFLTPCMQRNTGISMKICHQ